jgi:hypothetical protein
MNSVSAPASQLANASGFFIRTPMLEALHRQIDEWTQCGHTGGLILGEARQGKTKAISALSEALTNRNSQSIPLFRVHFGRRDLDSVRAVFVKIARTLGYEVGRGHTSDDLQERISIRLAEAALVNDDRKVVLVVDEAQMLKLHQFDAFAEIYNQLFEMRINFIAFFVANQDLFQPVARALLTDEYRYLRERFFNNLTYFHGIRTESELKKCLEAYDSYEVTDNGKTMSATAFFAPTLYNQGWRLADISSIYWHFYRERYGIPLHYTAWGMSQFIRTTNILLMDYLPLCENPKDVAVLEVCCIKSLKASGIEPALTTLLISQDD